MRKRTLLISTDVMEYGEAYDLQKKILEARILDKIEDSLLLLQHPPTFTYGRRYKESNLVSNKKYYEANGFAIYKTDRGGLATYHSPGQIIGYPILKMQTYAQNLKQYLYLLEEVMIRMLSDFDIAAERRDCFTGVWTENAKIGFLGVRIVFGYTMHGFSLNINNDLLPFQYINPCGIENVRITSIRELLSVHTNLKEVYNSLTKHYSESFKTQLIPYSINDVHRRIEIAKGHDRVVSIEKKGTGVKDFYG